LERRAGSDLLLMVHGLGVAKECFEGAWAAPELQGCSLLAPDLPGHGESSLPQGLACDMETCAAVLAALLATRSFERLHLVAHSMGGAPALLLLRDGSLPLASFTDVEGNLVAEDCGILSRRSAELPWEEFRDRKFPRLLAAFARSPDPTIQRWAIWARSCDPRAFHQACLSVVAWSDGGQLLDIFLNLPARLRYVAGARSAVPEVLACLESVPCEVLPDTGHDVMNERPERFWPLVADLVRDANGGP